MRPSQERIQEQANTLGALHPTGPLWPRDPESNLMQIILALAEELATVEESAENLISEGHPKTTINYLDVWEAALALPDDCAMGADTFQERRTAVDLKYLDVGDQRKAYFEQLAAAYGYEVQISEYRPFRCGMSAVGECLYDHGNKIRHQWTVNVLGKRITYFRCGQSYTTEPFYKLTRAQDLECIFNRLKPRQTLLTFIYNDEE